MIRTYLVQHAFALIVSLTVVAGAVGQAQHASMPVLRSVDSAKPARAPVPTMVAAGGSPGGTGAVVRRVQVGAVAAATDRLSGYSIIAGDNHNTALVTAVDTVSGMVLYARSLPGVFSAGGEVGNTESFLALDEPASRTIVTTIDFQAGAPMAGHVSVLDTRTGVVLRTFKTTTVAGAPAVADNGERVFVVNNRLFGDDRAQQGSVTVLNAGTGAVVRTVLAGYGPKVAVADVPARHVYIAAQRTDPRTNIPAGPATVSMLDATSGAARWTVHVLQNPLGMAVAAASRRILVTTQAGDTAANSAVTVLDADSGAIVRTARLGAEPAVPLSIGVDERDGRAYVLVEPLSGDGGSVTVLDTRSGYLVATVPVSQAQPYGIAVDAADGHVFVTAERRDRHGDYTGPGRVLMLDARTGAVLHTITVAPNPDSIALDARAARVFVASSGVEDPTRADMPVGRGTVTVLDAGSGAIQRTIRVGVSPVLAAVDEGRGRVLLLDDRGMTLLNTRVYS